MSSNAYKYLFSASTDFHECDEEKKSLDTERNAKINKYLVERELIGEFLACSAIMSLGFPF